MTDTDPRLDILLREAMPAVDDVERRLEEAWARVEDGRRAAAARRRPRRLRAVALTAGVVTAAAALAAVAPFVATRTGASLDPGEVGLGGTGEVFRYDGTDFAVQVATLAEDIPFADDADRSRVIANLVPEPGEGRDLAATTSVLRAGLARGAICSWMRSWEAADAADDESAVRRSLAGLRGAMTWPAVTDVDPHPSATGDYDQDTGEPGPTVFGALPGVIDAATAGDRDAVLDFETSANFCVYLDSRTGAKVPGTGGESPAPSEHPVEPVGTTPPHKDGR